jgi:hypothetical protein
MPVLESLSASGLPLAVGALPVAALPVESQASSGSSGSRRRRRPRAPGQTLLRLSSSHLRPAALALPVTVATPKLLAFGLLGVEQLLSRPLAPWVLLLVLA